MPAHEKTFKRYDPDQTMLMPTDMREWLPEDHLAYFISDIVEEMDLSAFYARYNLTSPHNIGEYPSGHYSHILWSDAN